MIIFFSGISSGFRISPDFPGFFPDLSKCSRFSRFSGFKDFLIWKKSFLCSRLFEYFLLSFGNYAIICIDGSITFQHFSMIEYDTYHRDLSQGLICNFEIVIWIVDNFFRQKTDVYSHKRVGRNQFPILVMESV